MDIKKKIEEIVAKIKESPDLMASFKEDPEKAIEGLVGIDIPDGSLDQITTGVKTALAANQVSGALDTLKKLF
ncbi:MAG: hypothetical protein K6E30_04260 [Lachnospiraceae bacterium]|nr:hypothetical protein [Lachnospiraceae bacterium]